MSPSPMAPVYMPQPPDLLQMALAQASGMLTRPNPPSRPDAASYIPQQKQGQEGPLAQALKKRLGIGQQDSGQPPGQAQSLGDALLQHFFGGGGAGYPTGPWAPGALGPSFNFPQPPQPNGG